VEIEKKGGTWIGTSRGGFNKEKIMKALVDNGIN
jgi:6-phosphofructokinase 1